MAELDIEKGTLLSSRLILSEYVKEGHHDYDPDGGELILLPEGTRLGVRFQKLDKHGLDSITSLWLCFGIWTDDDLVKIDDEDVGVINQTIVTYVFPRTFTSDGPKKTMNDLLSYEVTDPATGQKYTIDHDIVLDHIHVSQDIIDKYDALLGA